MNSDECVLRDLVGIVRVARECEGPAIHQRLHRPDDLLERSYVAVCGCPSQVRQRKAVSVRAIGAVERWARKWRVVHLDIQLSAIRSAFTDREPGV
jgi:hypothetical protein